MKDLFVGIDTSNYTTSIAVTDGDGNIVSDCRKLLTVKKGQRGLRQSDAFYQHIQNIPQLYKEAVGNIDVKNIKGVCVSTKPRNVEGSYMPVFTAGQRFAEVISETLGVELYETSHQEGHIKAIEAFNDIESEFLCFHISGGTMEILKVVPEMDSYDIEIIGKTLDISIGQLIDRVGVAMGYDFPCGPALDQMACDREEGSFVRIKPIHINNLDMNLSGIETQLMKYIGNIENEDVARKLFTEIVLCLQKLVDKCKAHYPEYPIVFAGGVSQSKFIRENINRDIVFGQYGADNAVGVALLGGIEYGAKTYKG